MGLVLCASSCEDTSFVEKFYTINVINNSTKDIRVFLAEEFTKAHYPDTSLPAIKPALQKASVNQSCYFDSKTPWEENLKKLSADTLSIFIIDNDVYENEPWDSVRIHYKILKRMDLSITDLKAKNYKIEYP